MEQIYQKLKKKIDIDIVISLFYLGFGIYAFSRIWQYSYIIDISNSLKSILRLISFFLLIPRIMFQDNIKEILKTILLLFSTAIICIICGGDKNIILIPMLLIGVKDIDIYKIIKILFIITLSCTLIHYVFFTIGYINDNNSFFSMFHISSYPVKNTVMFYDNNMWAIRFTCCIMQYMFLTDRNKNRYLKTFVLLLLSFFMLFVSQSRASFIICLFLILYMLIEKNSLFYKNIIAFRNVSIICSFILSILLIVMPMFQNSIFDKITGYLSGRPIIYNNAFNYMGINILPNINKFNNMSKVFGSYMLPDNSYISVFLKWGLLLSFIMFVFTLIFINKNKNEIIIDYFISVLSIWFIVEFISMEFVMYFVPLVIFNRYLSDSK